MKGLRQLLTYWMISDYSRESNGITVNKVTKEFNFQTQEVNLHLIQNNKIGKKGKLKSSTFSKNQMDKPL